MMQWLEFFMGHSHKVVPDAAPEAVKKEKPATSQYGDSSKFFSLLASVSDNSSDLVSATNNALENLCVYTGWPVGHAYIVDYEGAQPLAKSSKEWFIHDAIQQSKIAEFKTLSEKTEFAPGVGLIGKVIESRRYMSVDDVTTLPGYLRADAAKKNHIHGCFAFPIIDVNDGRVRGILEFFHYDKVEIGNELLALTEYIGKQVAFTYANIDSRERQKSLAALFEEQVTTSVDEMKASSASVASLARDLEKSIEQIETLTVAAKDLINTSLQELNASRDKGKELHDSTQEINTIAVNINKIADQTNLLALNATIEAARAGDVGRGFAVVAEEVKTLSQNTTQSTGHVSNMVHTIDLLSRDIQGSLDGSILASEKAIGSAGDIVNAVGVQKNKTMDLDSAAGDLEKQAKELALTMDNFLKEILE